MVVKLKNSVYLKRLQYSSICIPYRGIQRLGIILMSFAQRDSWFAQWNTVTKFWFCSVWRRKEKVSWCKIGLHFEENYSCSYGSMLVWKMGTDEDGAKFSMQ
jgi:hypothetical protein